MIQIWLADFTFYYKQTPVEKYRGLPATTFIVKDVITKRLPLRFLLNEELIYKRITRDMLDGFFKYLEDDPEIGLKKFTVNYIKKIGEANEVENSNII